MKRKKHLMGLIGVVSTLGLIATGCGSAASNTGNTSSTTTSNAASNGASSTNSTATSNAGSNTTSNASSNATSNATSQSTATQTPVQGGTLSIGMAGDALTLDPMLTTDEYSKPVESLLYDSLVKLGPKGDVEPDLATKWDVSSDGLTYTFDLRQNVKFHDGTTMTSQDVVYSFQRIMSKSLASPWASFFQDVQSVKAPDDNTVVVQLSQPDAPFLTVVASFLDVMNPTFVNSNNGNLKRVEDGTGPYKLSDWQPNNSITLVKDSDYFVPNQPYLDQIVFQIIPQDSSRIAALQSGQIQFGIFIDPSYYAQINALGSSGSLNVQKYLDSNYHLLGFNTKRKPFDDPKVRLAISYAINRNQILSGPGFNQGMVTGILTPALSKWAIPTSDYPSYTQNIAKAKELLKEAGYPNGFSFSIMAPTSFKLDLNSAVMIQSQLKQIGVTAKVEPTEWGTYVQNWVKRNFDSFTGENGDWTDPDLAMYAALHTGGSTNAFQFSNAQVDTLLEQGRAGLSFDQRYQTYAQLQKLLVQQSPMIYTFATNDLVAMSPQVKNYIHVTGADYQTLATAWLSK